CGVIPIYWASKGDKVAKLKYLIEKGIDINDQDKQTYICLHIASDQEKIGIVKYLAEQKSDWSVLIDNIEHMSLDIARQIEEENSAITKLLLLKGEKVMTQNVHDFIKS
ncbi:hypothetical protein GR268_45205, partial [Rhizobium leguminosarum]|nr:hypothetical protein [Rhizobium leguminosarum]